MAEEAPDYTVSTGRPLTAQKVAYQQWAGLRGIYGPEMTPERAAMAVAVEAAFAAGWEAREAALLALADTLPRLDELRWDLSSQRAAGQIIRALVEEQ